MTWACKSCGGTDIRSVEMAESHADLSLGTGPDGKPMIEDYIDGVNQDNLEWETVGYECANEKCMAPREKNLDDLVVLKED